MSATTPARIRAALASLAQAHRALQGLELGEPEAGSLVLVRADIRAAGTRLRRVLLFVESTSTTTAEITS